MSAHQKELHSESDMLLLWTLSVKGEKVAGPGKTHLIQSEQYSKRKQCIYGKILYVAGGQGVGAGVERKKERWSQKSKRQTENTHQKNTVMEQKNTVTKPIVMIQIIQTNNPIF